MRCFLFITYRQNNSLHCQDNNQIGFCRLYDFVLRFQLFYSNLINQNNLMIIFQLKKNVTYIVIYEENERRLILILFLFVFCLYILLSYFNHPLLQQLFLYLWCLSKICHLCWQNLPILFDHQLSSVCYECILFMSLGCY